MTARETPIPLPEDEYLLLVGQVAYMVSYLEQIILGDLDRLAAHIPPELKLTVEDLAGKSTGQIAGALERAVDEIDDQEVKAFIERGAQVLGDAADRRNHLLHARPATIGSNQRLDRWKAGDHRGPHLAFAIETDWLNDTIDALSNDCRALDAVRPRRS